MVEEASDSESGEETFIVGGFRIPLETKEALGLAMPVASVVDGGKVTTTPAMATRAMETPGVDADKLLKENARLREELIAAQADLKAQVAMATGATPAASLDGHSRSDEDRHHLQIYGENDRVCSRVKSVSEELRRVDLDVPRLDALPVCHPPKTLPTLLRVVALFGARQAVFSSLEACFHCLNAVLTSLIEQSILGFGEPWNSHHQESTRANYLRCKCCDGDQIDPRRAERAACRDVWGDQTEEPAGEKVNPYQALPHRAVPSI